jgi:signal transduction histidine kinase
MKPLIFKNYFFILLQLVTFRVVGQDVCYTCSRDSFISVLGRTSGNAERIKLLAQIIDLAPTTDSANRYIEELLTLNGSIKTIDGLPYRKLFEANALFKEKKYRESLDSYFASVELFDRSKKKMVNLLLDFRNIFNLLNIQPQRRAYYQKKLDYYLLNGPSENTAACYHGIAGYYVFTGNYNQAISYYLKAAEVFKRFYPYWYYNEIGIIGVQYGEWGNFKKALEYLNFALPKMDSIKEQSPFSENTGAYYQTSLAKIQMKLGKYSEALVLAEKVIREYKNKSGDRFYALGLLLKGNALVHSGKGKEAFSYIWQAKRLSDSLFNGRMTSFNSTMEVDYGLYEYFTAMKDFRAAEKYLLLANEKALTETANEYMIKYLKELTGFYLGHNRLPEAKKYATEYFDLRNKQEEQQNDFKIAAYENEKKSIEQLQNINALKQEQAIQQATLSKRNTILLISLVGLLLIALSMIFLYRQLLLNKRTVKRLKSTQTQLIHSEKMASLGELTAGIAHEIQNPLNFVNNFSEVSVELVTEMKDELAKGNKQEAILISNDLDENLQKISEHGKRAASIVKGMLQHSRKSTDKKEPTDINALVDEYVRLSYHGIRSKDKSFNAMINTNFDKTAGIVNVIPQDLGRVLLNLLNNAFYSVNEKKNNLNGTFQPIVSVSTKNTGKGVELSVKDNGTGIPEKVLSKIYQPFFTTKPTGQGTGLGLSLSYDIITKGHGGEMKVNSTEGEYAEFIISLPKSEI